MSLGSTPGGSGGVVRRDVRAESAQAQQEQMLRKGAAGDAAQQAIDEQTRRQLNIEQSQRITELQQSSRAEKQQFDSQSAMILNDLQRNIGRMSTADKIDKMETAATYTRLLNEKYRYELEDVGRKRRLYDAQAFDEALKTSIFGRELDMIRDNYSIKRALDQDEAAFSKMLSTIDVDAAIQLSKKAAEGAGETAMISGVGSAVSTGIDYYQRNKKS
jgi:hypothetical protein